MTIRELFREFVAAKRVRRDQSERDIALAWWGVRIYVMTQNKKQLPDLQELLQRPSAATERPAQQSHADMYRAMQQMSQQIGVPLRRLR